MPATACMTACSDHGRDRPRHRRLARHRPRCGAGAWPRPARMSSPSRAPSAGSKSSTTRSGRAGGAATLVPLDLKDMRRHRPARRARIFERWGKLDILLGNAGRARRRSRRSPISSRRSSTKVMAINVTANWRLIRSVDPLLRQSDAGRALFVTSGVAQARSAPIGASMRSRRPRWRRWSAPMPARSRRRRCGSTSSTPGRSARGCGPRPCPARTR